MTFELFTLGLIISLGAVIWGAVDAGVSDFFDF